MSLPELPQQAKINNRRLREQETRGAVFIKFLTDQYNDIMSLISDANEGNLHGGQTIFPDGKTIVPFWGHTVPVQHQDGYTTSIFFGKENSGCLGPLLTTKGVAIHAYTEQNGYGGDSRQLAYKTVMINLNYGKLTVITLDASGKQNIQEFRKDTAPNAEEIKSLTAWLNEMWEAVAAKIDPDV